MYHTVSRSTSIRFTLHQPEDVGAVLDIAVTIVTCTKDDWKLEMSRFGLEDFNFHGSIRHHTMALPEEHLAIWPSPSSTRQILDVSFPYIPSGQAFTKQEPSKNSPKSWLQGLCLFPPFTAKESLALLKSDWPLPHSTW